MSIEQQKKELEKAYNETRLRWKTLPVIQREKIFNQINSLRDNGMDHENLKHLIAVADLATLAIMMCERNF